MSTAYLVLPNFMSTLCSSSRPDDLKVPLFRIYTHFFIWDRRFQWVFKFCKILDFCNGTSILTATDFCSKWGIAHQRYDAMHSFFLFDFCEASFASLKFFKGFYVLHKVSYAKPLECLYALYKTTCVLMKLFLQCKYLNVFNAASHAVLNIFEMFVRLLSGNYTLPKVLVIFTSYTRLALYNAVYEMLDSCDVHLLANSKFATKLY